jgi:hypothetical protein
MDHAFQTNGQFAQRLGRTDGQWAVKGAGEFHGLLSPQGKPIALLD